jgi:hypothetical protein
MSHKLLEQLERQRKEREKREEMEKLRAQFKAADALKHEERHRKLKEEADAKREAMLAEQVGICFLIILSVI